MTQKDTLFIGIDVGGTSCQATAFSNDGKALAHAQAASVNLGVDVSSVIVALDSVLAQLTQQLQLSIAQVPMGIGCAGFSHIDARQRLLLWAQQFPHCHITSDIQIATLGANGGGECAVVIVGTGSCGAQYQNKQFVQIGGHGLLLGDHGSGGWLGVQAIKHLLAVKEQCAPATLLSHTIATFIAELNLGDASLEQSLVQYFNQYSSHDFALLAPSVFKCAQQGDAQALHLIETGLGHIEKLIRRVSANGTLPVFYVGGVVQPYLSLAQQYFPQHRLWSTELQPCIHSPEYGAMLFARSCYQPPSFA